MKEYWEITHTRGVATQAVWADQPDSALNKLTKAQHAALVDAQPVRAQARADAESALTAKSAHLGVLCARLKDLGTRAPGAFKGILDDEDELKEQLGEIFATDPSDSQEATLRRARLVLPLWQAVDAGRAALTPAQDPFKLNVKIGEATVAMGATEFKALIGDVEAALKDEAAAQHVVTAAKTALRAGDYKLDRANKRWYKAWMTSFPPGTPEGDAAQAQIPTEDHHAADPEPLEITTLTPQANHTITVAFDPAGGAHATTKELLYRLPGETEFGHSAPIMGASMIAGPFAAGAVVTFRTRVANSNPGAVLSAEKTAVAL